MPLEAKARGVSLPIITGLGMESIGRWRNRIGLFALLTALAALLLPYIGTETVYSASPPVAEALSPVAQQGTPVTIYLSGSDPDGDPLTFIIASDVANGALSDTGGTITVFPHTVPSN
ncbi:MAG: hypothetical protein J4O02_05060, partial [Chloroflexi bacterium]|nr:hypothetical protein [Chloroflexota bacterium]